MITLNKNMYFIYHLYLNICVNSDVRKENVPRFCVKFSKVLWLFKYIKKKLLRNEDFSSSPSVSFLYEMQCSYLARRKLGMELWSGCTHLIRTTLNGGTCWMKTAAPNKNSAVDTVGIIWVGSFCGIPPK